MPRKRAKSFDAPVVMQTMRLEVWVYVRCDQWKKKYRYTLINEFRQHVTAAKNEIIRGFELHNRYKDRKAYHYAQAQVELVLAESCANVMIVDEIGVMSRDEWAKFAEQVDNIRTGLSRLVNSLTKGVGGSEFPNCGTESASASHKDV